MENETLYCLEQTVARNINTKDASCKVLNGNEREGIQHWRKGSSCYKRVQTLVE